MKRIASRKLLLIAGLIFSIFTVVNGQAVPAQWRATLEREDSNLVVFNLQSKIEMGKTVFYVINGQERIRLTDIQRVGDSVFFSMPVFESSFRARVLTNGNLQGIWIKGTAARIQHWPFTAKLEDKDRFPALKGKPIANINGRWEVSFIRPNGQSRPAVAEFSQNNERITGTFLTPSGDYRYLDGTITGDSLMISTFDGAHAYLLTAKIVDGNKIIDGYFYAGRNGKEKWIASRNAKAKLPDTELTELKAGADRLDFRFPDLDGNLVSINDKRFTGKVVVVQIMGSWCPNCMDETRFLSAYYETNKHRGVEVISLAYEYSTDLSRSLKTLRKFQQQFKVGYPMLITGVSVADSLRTEKTLPQITPIKVFPTTIFIDRRGMVNNIHAGFVGPGAGQHHEEFKKEFYARMDELLRKTE